jgi:rhamnosyltransferase subunit B
MARKRILLCTFGSLGDLHPFLALAQELSRRGHSPVIATTPVYRPIVEAEGIAFHPVRPDLDPREPEILRRVMDRRKGTTYIFQDIILPALRESYDDTAAALIGADLIVTHPVTLSAYLLARKSSVPWVYIALSPASLYSVYDPPALTGFSFAEKLTTFGPTFQRCLRNTLGFLFESVWKPFRKFEKELGLPAERNPLLWAPSADLVLGLFSPALGAPQRDWPNNSHATGFLYFDHDHGNSPELQSFLDSGDPPIVFTLGSAAVGAAGNFYQQSAEAAHQLGRRAILLTGNDPANRPKGDLPPGIIAVPYAPHAAVFPRAAAIVHQGGIGTTAEAMRACRPMLVVHYSHDQPDNALRLKRLGVARSIPSENYNTATAVREIKSLLDDPSYAQCAAKIAAQLRSETGAATACDLLETLFHSSGPRC